MRHRTESLLDDVNLEPRNQTIFVKYVRLKIWAYNDNHEVLMDSRAASYITRHFGSQYIDILSHKYIYAHI